MKLPYRKLVIAACLLAALLCMAGTVRGQHWESSVTLTFPQQAERAKPTPELTFPQPDSTKPQRYLSADGCNWCTDLGNGLASCTVMACIKSVEIPQIGADFVLSATWADADGKAKLAWCLQQPAPADAESQIKAALAEWAKYIQVTFVRCPVVSAYKDVDDMVREKYGTAVRTYSSLEEAETCNLNGDRTLTFAWVPWSHGDWDFVTSQVVHAHMPPPAVPEPLAGDVHFWRDYDWTEPGLIYRIALHEIGHALGLQHTRDPWGVMYDVANGTLTLQRSDIEAVRRLYARRCYGVECAWRWTP